MTNQKKLSIIVPVFNEIKTIEKVFAELSKANIPWKKEIVWVDDGSSDGSSKILLKLKRNPKNSSHKFVFHKTNKGKGAAFKSGLRVSKGDYVVVFDSDGECDASDLFKLSKKAEKGFPVVTGTRNRGRGSKNHFIYWYLAWGVKVLAQLINVLYNQNISDPAMCLKLIERKFINFSITEDRFGYEIELIAKLAKQGILIEEIPVKYYPRKYEEGKKLTIKDGLRSFYLILKFRFTN